MPHFMHKIVIILNSQMEKKKRIHWHVIVIVSCAFEQPHARMLCSYDLPCSAENA